MSGSGKHLASTPSDCKATMLDERPIKKQRLVAPRSLWHLDGQATRMQRFVVPKADSSSARILYSTIDALPLTSYAFEATLAHSDPTERDQTHFLLCRLYNETEKRPVAFKFITWDPSRADSEKMCMEEATMGLVVGNLCRLHIAPMPVLTDFVLCMKDLALPPTQPWAEHEAFLRQFYDNKAKSTKEKGCQKRMKKLLCYEKKPQGEDFRALCIASEYIHGGIARYVGDYFVSRGWDASRALLSLYAQLTWGLTALLSIGVVHCDIHPENLMLNYGSNDNGRDARNDLFQLITDTGKGDCTYCFFDPGTGDTCEGLPMLKLIDYGLSQSITTPLDYVPTAMGYRPPEYFITIDPLRPMFHNACSPPTHFSHASDVWSAAMSFVTIMCGGIGAGGSTPMIGKYSIHEQFPSFVPAPKDRIFATVAWADFSRIPMAFLKAVEDMIAYWKETVSISVHGIHNTEELSIITLETPLLVASHLWRMGMLFGLPRERHWRGVEAMPFWKLLHQHGVLYGMTDSPDSIYELAPRMKEIVDRAIGLVAPEMALEDKAALMGLLAAQLQWSPRRRPTATDILTNNPLFQKIGEHFKRPSPTDAESPGSTAITWTMSLALSRGGILNGELGHKFQESVQRPADFPFH